MDEPVFGGTVCVYQTNRNTAKVVFLVHGIGDTASRDWDKQIDALAEYYRVIAIDLPGFGRSGGGDKYYTPERYSRLIDYVADKYALLEFDLIGHSMGGAISLLYASRNPSRVRHLVLVDVAGILHRLAIGKYVVSGVLADNNADRSKVESYVIKIIEKFERLFSFSSDDLADSGEYASAGINLVEYDFSSSLSKLTVPTQIIWGSEDKISPLRTGKVLLYRIRNSNLEVMKGVGHVPMKENAAEFNRQIMRFLMTDSPVKIKKEPDAIINRKPLDAVCDGETGRHFEGHFRTLKIKNCSNVVIRNANIDKLDVYESRVTVEYSDIGGVSGVGLDVVGSDVKITASRVSGNVSIRASRSRLDLAGVDLFASEDVVRVDRGSRMIFSISTIQVKNKNKQFIHKALKIGRGEKL